MKLAVVITTFNGGQRLREVLEGYARVVPPASGWTMTIVDNASTDGTPALLASFRDRLPLTILREPVPGKNRALNRALDDPRLDADLIVFADDDAVPDRAFLTEWQKAAAFPDVDLFGATIVLRFPADPPRWLRRFDGRFGMLFAEQRCGAGAIDPGAIFGPNMAVRWRVFAGGARFDDRFGPNAADIDYPMGGETEFCMRVGAQRRAAGYFLPGPIVHHIVRPEQLTRAWVAGRVFRHSRGMAMIAPARAGRSGVATAKHLFRLYAHAAAGVLLRRDKSWWQYHRMRGFESGYAAARGSERAGAAGPLGAATRAGRASATR